MFGGAAGRHPQQDAQAIVIGVAQYVGFGETAALAPPLRAQRRGVARNHVGVHGITPRGDDDCLRADGASFAEVLPCHPNHALFVVQNQCGGPGFVTGLDAEVVDPLDQQVDDHAPATGFTGHRKLVSARRRNSDVLERPHLLVAGIHETLGVGLDDRLLRVVAALELETQVFQPIEVVDAALAVGADLVVLWFLRHRNEVLVHLRRGIWVAGGLLNRGAATEVEVPAGHRGGPAGGRRALQHQHARARRRSAHGSASARDAETDNHHVDIVRPFLDIACVHGRRDVCTHFCSCFT